MVHVASNSIHSSPYPHPCMRAGIFTELLCKTALTGGLYAKRLIHYLRWLHCKHLVRSFCSDGDSQTAILLSIHSYASACISLSAGIVAALTSAMIVGHSTHPFNISPRSLCSFFTGLPSLLLKSRQKAPHIHSSFAFFASFSAQRISVFHP